MIPAIIPPPAKPANMSPPETLSLIQPNTVLIDSHIFDTTLIIPLPTFGNILPNLPRASDTAFRMLEMPPAIVVNTPVNPFESKPLFKAVKKSPTAAVADRKRSTNAFTPAEVINLPNAFATPPKILPNMETTENKPLNVLFSLAAVESLIFILAVIFLRPSVKEANFLPVIAGKISWKASLIGFAILRIPSKTFLKEASKSSRPPRSTQSCTILLRASDDLLIASLSTSLTDVHNSLASSKSPTTIRQVPVHPEPKASFSVSIN